MIKFKHASTLFFIMLFALSMQAQAEYDVRFINTVGCDDSTLLVDIEVKATDTDPGFFMSEQNYRFSYNRDAIANPVITKQISTGFIPGGPGTLGFTLYSPHNLTGTLDTVVSYNVELQGGDGTFLTPDTWVYIGQLGFDLLAQDACYDLKWHEVAFPPTFVGELVSSQRFDAEGALYTNAASCASCLLPMELTSFTGDAKDCKIDLEWKTASEINTSHVIVQRSVNGADFHNIARVDAAGNSTTLQQYSFTDYAILSTNNYYRLEQVDADGLIRYSDIIQVNTNCVEDNIGTLDVFPNPVQNDDLNMRLLSSKNAAANVTIMDVTGRIISQQALQVAEGINTLNVSVGGLTAGTYFVQIEGEGWRSSSEKFIKINK